VNIGKYNFDYSKNPIQLDIKWNDNMGTMRGIVLFVGEDKSKMKFVYSYFSERPTIFDGKEELQWLTKKVKK